MKKSSFLYIFGFIIMVAGILISVRLSGNYAVSVIIFPIPFIFTFGKPETLVSALTLIMAAIVIVLFLIYIMVIMFHQKRQG